MNTDQQLQQLEQRIEELINISSRLRHENDALIARETRLIEERAAL